MQKVELIALKVSLHLWAGNFNKQKKTTYNKKHTPPKKQTKTQRKTYACIYLYMPAGTGSYFTFPIQLEFL